MRMKKKTDVHTRTIMHRKYKLYQRKQREECTEPLQHSLNGSFVKFGGDRGLIRTQEKGSY